MPPHSIAIRPSRGFARPAPNSFSRSVPGAYSLSARSAEEQIALAAILGLGETAKPDLCLVVVDAGQLVRNLYLVLQIVELCVPAVSAP